MSQKLYNWNLPKQDKLKDWSKPNSESHGNCWQHAIAALLQIPYADVPDFLGLAIDQKRDMDSLTQEWLTEMGFVMVSLRCESIWFQYNSPKVPWLACGPTPRSKRMHQHHVVVMMDSEMVYDPHPDGTGLTAIQNCYLIFPIPNTEGK